MSENIDHKVVKEQVAERYKIQGFNVEKEKRLSNGFIVDIVAENKDQKIAIEIGALNGKKREQYLENHFDEFEHIRLKGRKKARQSYTQSLDEKVRADVRIKENKFRKLKSYIDSNKKVRKDSKQFYIEKAVELALEHLENKRSNKTEYDSYKELREQIKKDMGI